MSFIMPHNILRARTRQSEFFQSAPHRESAIGTRKNFSVARDERYLTRAMFLRRLPATYELHCNNRYSMISRLTQRQYDIRTHPTAVIWSGLLWSTYRIYELVCAQRDVKPYSVDTPTVCCYKFFFFFLLLHVIELR